MALTLTPTYSSSNSLTNYDDMIIDDSTGTYDAGTNPGGYGAPNPDRADLGLVLVAQKKGYGNIADTELEYSNTGNDFDTIASWTVDVTVDGWHEAVILGIPIWSAGTYDQSQAIVEADVVYICDANGTTTQPSVSGWTVATQTNLEAIRDDLVTYSPTSTVYSGTLNTVLTSLGDIGYGDSVAADLSKDCAPECYDDITETNKIWAYLEGAKISAARSKFMEAERKVLIYTDLIAGKDCKNC